MNPIISIILPTYNGGKYIRRAIDSIISQSFNSWELLVIDDGSSDDTESFIKEYIKINSKIIYIKNEVNLGIQKTLNKGLREAKGEYIARIDDDDEWIDKDKLKKQVLFLDDNFDYVLVGTGVVVIDENNNELFRYLLPEKNEDIRNKILGKNCFIHSSVMFKKDIVLKVGGYDESQNTRHVEDYDLWLRMGILGKFANLPIYAVNFTQREGSLSSKNKIEQFKKDLILIKSYKINYPYYINSLFKGYLRFFLYKIYNVFPVFLKNKIIKIYKIIY
jgi:glycosyltransferase involved in cell wall biosynthesis